MTRVRHGCPECPWLVGSKILQVFFAKEPYKRGYILQKRPMILSILLTVEGKMVTRLAWRVQMLVSSRKGQRGRPPRPTGEADARGLQGGSGK